LIVLGFRNHRSSAFPGALCAFEAGGDLDDPVWERRVETNEVLPELRSLRLASGDQFFVRRAWLVDVFPDEEFPLHPGREIVVHFCRSIYSQGVIRIYDLRGDLLYQVWHDGIVNSCHWMSKAGLLVFAGNCHWPYHDEKANLLGDKLEDLVVFALRPEMGFVATEYLDYLACEPGDDRLDPAWYLRLRPDLGRETASPRSPVDVFEPELPYDADRSVGFSIWMDDETKSYVHWTLDRHGEEIAGSRVRSDGYKLNQNLHDDDPRKLDFPADHELKLVPMRLGDIEPAGEAAPSDSHADRP
jgi:hypothetical protein